MAAAAYHRRLTLLYLLYLRRLARNKRKYWIHPIVQARYIEGAFYVLFERLQNEPSKFFNYFRMSECTFNYLLTHLMKSLQKQNMHFRLAVPPKEMLVVTLRYLASGCSLTELHYTYRLGISTLSTGINFVCSTIWTIFSTEHLEETSEHKWKIISERFKTTSQFPNCLGAIDGKHIRIQNFPRGGSMYQNYKKFFSIVLLAVVDSDYLFTFVDIGAYGKDCDSSILQNTHFWNRMMKKKLKIPQPTTISAEVLSVPYVFVADNAFPLGEHILCPYAGHNMSVKQRVFNYRLSRARRYVECAFGIMSNKWRIFHRPIDVAQKFAKNIVKACVILHNIVRKRDGFQVDDMMLSPNPSLQNLDIIYRTKSTDKTGRGVRTCFANYFVSGEGSLPWQLSKI